MKKHANEEKKGAYRGREIASHKTVRGHDWTNTKERRKNNSYARITRPKNKLDLFNALKATSRYMLLFNPFGRGMSQQVELFAHEAVQKIARPKVTQGNLSENLHMTVELMFGPLVRTANPGEDAIVL